jgi:tRNA dimethylallyltransferase
MTGPILEKVKAGSTVFAIVGPTAVGKTLMALRVAPALKAEIISVDSMQVYRGMDIGTSKPSEEERAAVAFHMLNIADPLAEFSVALFKELADKAMIRVVERGRVPLLVGGSGLYYRALIDDLDFANTTGAEEFRVEMEEELSDMSDLELHSLLADLDPASAGEIPPSNHRRVLKAIEVARRGNRLISERQPSWSDFRSPYDLRVVGLEMERASLYRLIDRRVDVMMSRGLEGEVRNLRDAGLRKGTTAGEAIGYRQLLDYLDGRINLEQAVVEIKTRSRNYAKRQLTWFRKDTRVKWFHVEGGPETTDAEIARALEETAELILEYLLDKPDN